MGPEGEAVGVCYNVHDAYLPRTCFRITKSLCSLKWRLCNFFQYLFLNDFQIIIHMFLGINVFWALLRAHFNF